MQNIDKGFYRRVGVRTDPMSEAVVVANDQNRRPDRARETVYPGSSRTSAALCKEMIGTSQATQRTESEKHDGEDNQHRFRSAHAAFTQMRDSGSSR